MDEVLRVHADQEEGDHEEVHVLPLPFREIRCGEQSPQVLGGEVPVGRRLAVYRVVEERVVLRDAALPGVVEDRLDVPEVNVPGVLLRRGQGEERVEAVEPSERDVGEREPLGLLVEGEDPRGGGQVDLLGPGLQLRLRGVCPEYFQEALLPAAARRHLLQDPVADLAGREPVELPPALQVQEDGVDFGLPQLGGDLYGGILRLEGAGVPVGGEEADAGGEVGDRAVLGDGDLEEGGFPGRGLPGVEIEFRGDHGLRRCLRKSQTSRKQKVPILHIFARKCTTVAFFLLKQSGCANLLTD